MKLWNVVDDASNLIIMEALSVEEVIRDCKPAPEDLKIIESLAIGKQHQIVLSDPEEPIVNLVRIQTLVIIESPLAGDVVRNRLYAQDAMLDSLRRGEAPFLSHLLYPQVLNDDILVEREAGIEAGLSWGKCAHLTAVYEDQGISYGMRRGMDRAEAEGRPIERRKIRGHYLGYFGGRGRWASPECSRECQYVAISGSLLHLGECPRAVKTRLA